MRLATLFALFALTACGIDGPPSPPPGSVDVSGDARIGVVGGI